MITVDDIMETNRMITENKLDVRTITMGISLRGCAHPNIKQFCDNVYDRITTAAEFLVKTGEDIEAEYGIPIIHKRVSVTPIAIAAEACKISPRRRRASIWTACVKWATSSSARRS